MTDLQVNDGFEETRLKLQNFLKGYVHKEPKPEEIRTNKHANNSKYIPISFLEMQLDEMFFGLWQTKNFNSKVIANEIVGELELLYFHPVAKTWLSRTGAGAVQIQLKSVEKGGSGDITNIKDKITNTLTKDYPHLKAECFRNACLSIGKSFGRDLNREFDDQYSPVLKDNKPKETAEYISKILILLDEYTGKDKEEIRLNCVSANNKGLLTKEFAETMIKKLGGTL